MNAFKHGLLIYESIGKLEQILNALPVQFRSATLYSKVSHAPAHRWRFRPSQRITSE